MVANIILKRVINPIAIAAFVVVANGSPLKEMITIQNSIAMNAERKYVNDDLNIVESL